MKIQYKIMLKEFCESLKIGLKVFEIKPHFQNMQNKSTDKSYEKNSH